MVQPKRPNNSSFWLIKSYYIFLFTWWYLTLFGRRTFFKELKKIKREEEKIALVNQNRIKLTVFKIYSFSFFYLVYEDIFLNPALLLCSFRYKILYILLSEKVCRRKKFFNRSFLWIHGFYKSFFVQFKVVFTFRRLKIFIVYN